jgi:protoporphyrinogen oxidase
MSPTAPILIIGAGPTGLGAAWRLHELGHTDWHLVEATDTPGGLAGSVTDDHGYTWDNGGHVQFSHYLYFDRLMDELLREGWIHHERESWVWIMQRFVPYPFQSNIRRLPPDALWDCVEGLLRRPAPNGRPRPEDFESFIHEFFGDGLAKHFMTPYNTKVWAHPPRMLATNWVGERVAPVDLDRVLRNIVLQRDDVAWGPNNTFRFPLHGGTGSIWRTLAARLPQEKITFNTRLESLDLDRRVARLSDGTERLYGALISTIPLDILAEKTGRDDLRAAAKGLLHSATHVIGVGVKGVPSPDIGEKCWMYFPESDCPFYRVTVFSNYSPNNVPDITRCWSLMAEISESEHRPIDTDRVVEETLQGMVNTRLIASRDDVENVYHRRLPYGYPIPSRTRDGALDALLPALHSAGVYSRGRFGAWKYEVSNQDHGLMQGVEIVEHLLNGADEQTVWQPDFVNQGGAKHRSTDPESVAS